MPSSSMPSANVSSDRASGKLRGSDGGVSVDCASLRFWSSIDGSLALDLSDGASWMKLGEPRSLMSKESMYGWKVRREPLWRRGGVTVSWAGGQIFAGGIVGRRRGERWVRAGVMKWA